MTPKPQWLLYAVDFAQIVSAAATALAVGVSLWLARRNEQPRVRLVAGQMTTVTIRPDGDTSKENALALNIANAGLLPLRIQDASIFFSLKNGKNRIFGLGKYDSTTNTSTFPASLEHGHTLVLSFPIRLNESPWDCLPNLWWYKNRPFIRVTTSLGKTYQLRLKRSFIQQLLNTD
ncbi:hypothetical protein [Oxalicibacterium faecigallinarum]|uniref:hypothetical protein n=1 Tax=Oxalicibacterium faecigallinarum TaxID=573741 RepID=UPI00166E7CC8|nr:hypothetical protein [Oxalicibacterium faecigallinarum]